MSYSYSKQLANKDEARAFIAAELERVVQSQPCHVLDAPQAKASAEAALALLPDDDTRDVYVSGSGSLSGDWDGATLTAVHGISISVNVSHATRKPA